MQFLITLNITTNKLECIHLCMNYTNLVQVSSRAFYEDIFCAKSYFGMFTYKPRLQLIQIIIQQIVTLSKYGHDSLNICHP